MDVVQSPIRQPIAPTTPIASILRPPTRVVRTTPPDRSAREEPMTTVRTFISHSSADKDRVRALQRRIAPYGVRGWIDERDLEGKVGTPLRHELRRAITSPECRSLSLYLSAASVESGWVAREVEWALAQLADGYRIIPIALDPVPALALPPAIEVALRRHAGGFDTLFLDAADPAFEIRYAASVLDAAGVTDAPEIVLHLGYRDGAWLAHVPAVWRDLPTIDLRLSYPCGARDLSPTEDEWAEIERGLTFLHSRLAARRIHVTGLAPLGAGVLVGHLWDRGTGKRVDVWNERAGVVWAIEPSPVVPWSPGGGRWLSATPEGDLERATRATVSFLSSARASLQEPDVRTWSRTRDAAQPLVLAHYPADLETPEQAAAVLAEVRGVLTWLKRAYPAIGEVDLVLGLPLGLCALLAHELRQLGLTLRYHDQIYPPAPPWYRLVKTWA